MKKKWKDQTPEERLKTITWSVATSCAIETGENPVAIYERLMKRKKELKIRPLES